MKKPEVDYREFRLSRLNEERFSHLKLLWGWVVYFVLFFLTENLIPAENCYPVHIPLDDMIPFTEVFVIPYALWYLLVVWSLLYFALYNVDNFKNLQTYIIITQVFAMTAYILFPTRQDLRPEVFARDNIFTQIVGFIYSMDTNTGVCPSLHVAYSIGIASTWLREKSVSAAFKAGMTVFCLAVCLSTAFVKQHSVLDGIMAIPVCLFAEWWVFHRKKKTRENKGE